MASYAGKKERGRGRGRRRKLEFRERGKKKKRKEEGRRGERKEIFSPLLDPSHA